MDSSVAVTTIQPEPPPVSPPPAPPDCAQPLDAWTGSLESVNFPGLLMRHRNYLADLLTVATPQDRADASFVFAVGLTGAPDTVSFRSVFLPKYYLRHQNSRLKLQPDDGTDLFRRDATFALRPNTSRGMFVPIRFESVNYPGSFIRHQNFQLFVARDDGSLQFTKDSTWRRLPPPPSDAPPGTLSFQAWNFPGFYLRHRNALGYITPVGSPLDRSGSRFVVRQALSGLNISGSLESVNHPGFSLRHRDWRIRLEQFDSRHIAPFELYIQAGRDVRLRSAAAPSFAAYDQLATRILAGLGVPEAERLASSAIALVFGLQLRSLATGRPAEELVDALMLLARGAQHSWPPA